MSSKMDSASASTAQVSDMGIASVPYAKKEVVRKQSSRDVAVRVSNLSKCFHIYDRPEDRLKQSVMPRIRSLFQKSPKQYFREFWALRNISFEIKKGETVGIIGRNGSGKSTLLQIICGTLSPTSGTVETHGRVAALLELGSGFNPEFTGRENVLMSGAVLGLSSKDIENKFDLIANFADIGEFIEQPVKTYSSGMYARLAFSVAVHVDPNILIVDEILSVGDTLFQAKCVKKFYEIKESGCTIIFVSHDEYQVRHVCDYAVYLRTGESRYFGHAEDAFDQYKYDVSNSREASSKDSQELKEPVSLPHPLSISDVSLVNNAGKPVSRLKTHETVTLIIKYEKNDYSFHEKVSLVVNLYRHDSSYMFGTTTLMEGIPPFHLEKKGEIEILFPSIPLLRGRYNWRVAVNDERGVSVYAEACPICPFDIIDDFQSVGVVDIPRKWRINGETLGTPKR